MLLSECRNRYNALIIPANVEKAGICLDKAAFCIKAWTDFGLEIFFMAGFTWYEELK